MRIFALTYLPTYHFLSFKALNLSAFTPHLLILLVHPLIFILAFFFVSSSTYARIECFKISSIEEMLSD